MIFGRHSVLKRGCSTWDRQQMPQEEYQGRLERLRQQMAQQGLDALVIYGDNYAYADLCYLTNYFPKVRGGIGVIPRSGPISLLLNIGSRDVPFAKSLTWVDDVRASGQLGRDGAEVLKEKGLAQAKVGLVDSGKGMPLPQLEELKESLPQVQWQPSHSMLQQMRLQKSAKELAALREAGRVLNEICDGAREFINPGRKEYEIIADVRPTRPRQGSGRHPHPRRREAIAAAELQDDGERGQSLGGLPGDTARALLGGGRPHVYFVQRVETSKRLSKGPGDCRSDGHATEERQFGQRHRRNGPEATRRILCDRC